MKSHQFESSMLADISIQELIDYRADETPDTVFMIDPESHEVFTYSQIQRSCQAFAGRLISEGIKPGASIAYAMSNGSHSVKTVLGTLYGGFLATAVNLVSGSNTISYVLEHSASSVVFTDAGSSALIDEVMSSGITQAKVLQISDDWFAESDNTKIGKIPSEVDGLLMYTSGTTGIPKGVVHTHRSLLAGGYNTSVAHKLGAKDIGLCVLPLYHINAFCVSLMGALASGGALVVPPKFSVRSFWSLVRKYRCSWFSVVPTQISYLIHEAETNGHDSEGLEALRFGRSASAPLATEVQQSFEDRFKVPIIETMGLTETAAQILSNPIDGKRKIGSPGLAFGNEVKIGDEKQIEVPRGEEGELLVRGPNVMRLYRNNESATAETITSDGWLRTGDLGRMDDEGYVFVTGRLKELIIKGGENIAPREVDEVLYSHPDVVEAAAFARESSRYGQTVEASVMLCEGSRVSESELIALCRNRIGEFKSPDRVHILPELPKGPSGKIQRIKLADLVA